MKTLDKVLLFGPVSCWVLGFTLNKIVMGANAGSMPVMWPVNWGGDGGVDSNHILMTARTHLNFFGDWINMHNGVASIGDMLMDIYNATWIPGVVAYVARTTKN